MPIMKSRLEWLAIAGALGAILFVSRSAAACEVDTDCPDSACGGQVCNWPEKTCQPAGTRAAGSDGWCNTTDDCKCKDKGATCDVVICTFTKAPDGSSGSGGSSSSSGGSSGSGGSSASSGGSTGSGGSSSSSGGSTGSGGSSNSGSGGSSSGHDAGTNNSSGGSGGCSVGSPAPASAVGVALALATLVGARRRARRRS